MKTLNKPNQLVLNKVTITRLNSVSNSGMKNRREAKPLSITTLTSRGI
jgi:hypothetical protein